MRNRPEDAGLERQIRAVLRREGDEIVDLHVWQLGPGHHGAIVSILSSRPEPTSAYKSRLGAVSGLDHLTIEVQPRTALWGAALIPAARSSPPKPPEPPFRPVQPHAAARERPEPRP